jgi:hypothetical protein
MRKIDKIKYVPPKEAELILHRLCSVQPVSLTSEMLKNNIVRAEILEFDYIETNTKLNYSWFVIQVYLESNINATMKITNKEFARQLGLEVGDKISGIISQGTIDNFVVALPAPLDLKTANVGERFRIPGIVISQNEKMRKSQSTLYSLLYDRNEISGDIIDKCTDFKGPNGYHIFVETAKPSPNAYFDLYFDVTYLSKM